MTAPRCGADRLETLRPLLKGARVGLVTAPTGRTAAGRSTVDALGAVCGLEVLFGPEHGVRGDVPAGERVETYTDPRTGLPVFSLYGPDEASRRLNEEMLRRFDVLVYDIQDVGSRYYTFLSTLRYLVHDCARAGKPLVVLDRPNPLGGLAVEGAPVEPGLTSFVGCCPVPNRYGLTAGEFAKLVNGREGAGCDLTVVPCRGWRRDMLWPEWGLPWVMPSPNIPRFETALLYAGTCLFEGTNLSEGRGTADPFAIVGAPWVADAEGLCAAFNGLSLPGVAATPVFFIPTCSKHQGSLCGGVHLHVTDCRAIRPLAVGVHLLALFQSRYPEAFAVLPPKTAGGRPFLSLLAGHRTFETPGWRPEAVLAAGEAAAERFADEKAAYHLYD